MKFVFIVAVSVLAFAFSDGELPLAKMCCLRGKTRDKYVCRGQMIFLNAEMARVANVERISLVYNEDHEQYLPLSQSYEPHSNTSKAISSLRRGGEKHALVSTRNAVVHQLPAKLFFRKGRQPGTGQVLGGGG